MRVPSPATGKTALRTALAMKLLDPVVPRPVGQTIATGICKLTRKVEVPPCRFLGQPGSTTGSARPFQEAILDAPAPHRCDAAPILAIWLSCCDSSVFVRLV